MRIAQTLSTVGLLAVVAFTACLLPLIGCVGANDGPAQIQSTEIGANKSQSIAPKDDAATQVLVRWKVEAGRQDTFVKAWRLWAEEMGQQEPRERGAGLLLQSKNGNGEFLVITRLNKSGSPAESKPDKQATGAAWMTAASVLDSAKFEEISDRLDRSSWQSKLIRIYYLKVKVGEEDAFIQTWLQVTKAIGEKVRGARGGLLLRARADRSMFVEVVRWDSLEDWRAFVTGPAADPEGFRKIFSLMTVTSAEEFDEVAIY